MKPISHERLLELLEYDPCSGVFRWKVERQYNARKGQVAGKKTKRGYWWIAVSGHSYAAHRLAWFYVHGQWPVGEIDHINRNKIDNRILNLRLATRQENSGNMFRDKQNTSGFKGVYWHKGAEKWASAVKKNGKRYYLGLFETAEQAHDARLAKAVELFGEFAL